MSTEKIKKLLPIVDFFAKNSPRKVSDLKAFLEKKSESSNIDAPIADGSLIDDHKFVDALVILTSDALPTGEGFRDDYYTSPYRDAQGGVPTKAYLLMDSSNNGTQHKYIKDLWMPYIKGKVQLGTLLTDVLTEIINFATNKVNFPNADTGFIKFLTDLQNTQFKDLGGQMGMNADKKAMDVISKAIEAAAGEFGKKCVVFTGAPGTGKTYCVEQYVDPKMKGFAKQYFVQFHSSYDYTDFVEGLRPVQQGGPMTFVRMDGIFKAFCREVVRLNAQNGDWAANFPEDKPLDGSEGEYPDGLKGECPPKDPKDWNMYYFVIDEINRADLGRVFGELMYCFEKRGKPVTTQYANLTTHDGNGNHIPNDYFQKSFFIPQNVVIIGTMNDIDRSVETFDFALRRRFDWIEIEADAVMGTSLAAMGVPADIISQLVFPKAENIKIKMDEITPGITKMNYVIEHRSGLGGEFKIGPAYFKNLKTLMDQYTNKDPKKTRKEVFEEALTDIWKHNIEPILREYVRGRQDDTNFVKACRDALGVSEEFEGEQ